MDEQLTARLTGLLLHAARSRHVLPYTRFHAIFPRTMALTHRYALLDAVLEHLPGGHDADYGALLSRDNGLPGPEFFRRFKRHHLAEYTAIAGDPRYRNASLKEQRLLVDIARTRVYEQAARHAPDTPPERHHNDIEHAAGKRLVAQAGR